MFLIVQNMKEKTKTLLMRLVSAKLIWLMCYCTQLWIALGLTKCSINVNPSFVDTPHVLFHFKWTTGLQFQLV